VGLAIIADVHGTGSTPDSVGGKIALGRMMSRRVGRSRPEVFGALARSRFGRRVGAQLPPRVKALVAGLAGVDAGAAPRMRSEAVLRTLLADRYHVRNLKGIDALEFRRTVEGFAHVEDADVEGYRSPEMQRTRSVRFEWGHDFDFGEFQVSGFAGNRPVLLLSAFIDRLSALPYDLNGLRVLDIGCWTGGTSLLLAAMGASVVAIEEVRKYVEALKYLCRAFGVDNVEPRAMSLFEMTGDEFQDAFDIVLFAGVLYHLSDPVLGTRIVFNAVRPGGTCLLETRVIRSKDRNLEYAGRNEPGKDPGSANWFFPSPTVVSEIMGEVGFDVMSSFVHQRPGALDRMYAVGKKHAQLDMLRAGLAVPNIR
jgi:2-polyprenyl-3-methyl-5-hydroxy-6-metoxy-1,4-benzoquinol methylase